MGFKKMKYCKFVVSIFFFLELFSSLACSKKDSTSNVDAGVFNSNISLGQAPVAIKQVDIKTVFNKNDQTWQATLTWSDTSPDITGFKYAISRVEQDTSTSENYQNVTSPYVIKKIKSGTTQIFKILTTALINGTSVTVSSQKFTKVFPIDDYTVKPGAFTMTATPGDGQATISWGNADRTTFYIIQSGSVSGTYPKVVAKAVTSPYIDKSLTNGVTLYYTVIAVNSAGSTNASAEAIVTPLATTPTMGSFGTVTANPGDSTVSLSWPPVTGAATYTIKRADGNSSNFSVISTTLLTNYTDTGLTNGVQYHYIISADQVSSSQVDATPIAVPGAFTVSASPADSQVDLTWTSSSGAASYTLQYGTSPGSFPQTVPNVTSPYSVTGLSNNIIYYFRIVAINPSGTTNASPDGISATPAAAPSTCTIDGDLVISTDDDVTAFNANGCDTLNGSVIAGVSTDIHTSTTTINLSNLKTITGGMTIQTNNNLTELSFPLLQTVGGTINTNQNYSLVSVNFPHLTTVSGNFGFSANPIQSFNVPLLHDTGDLYIDDFANISLSLPALVSINNLFITTTGLTEIAAPNLQSITNSFTLNFNASLTNLSFPALTSIGVNFTASQNSTLSPCVPLGILTDNHIALNNPPNISNNGGTDYCNRAPFPFDANVGATDQSLNINTIGDVVGAQTFSVKYGTSPGVYDHQLNGLTRQDFPVIINGLTNGITYYVMITAINPAGSTNANSEIPSTPN